jgi:hypothetical protein
VNGTDHDNAVVTTVEQRLDALVAKRSWTSKDAWVVNQREPPHWDLGINLALGSGPSARCTDDILAIATELAALHGEVGCTFVIGIHDAKSDDTKDLFVIDTTAPDLDALRAALTTQAV